MPGTCELGLYRYSATHTPVGVLHGIEQKLLFRLPAHFLRKREKANLEIGRGWENLPGVEFQVPTSIDRLKNMLHTGEKSGVSSRFIFEHWVDEVHSDLRGFSQEYILKTPLTPVSYVGKITPNPNDFRLLSHNFRSTHEASRTSLNSFFIVRDMINTVERKGAVLRGWERVEQLAREAPRGSVIVMTSPDGPTGIPGTKDYPNSRTYILEVVSEYWEKGVLYRTLKGFDVLSDLTIDEHRRLLNTALPDGYKLPNDVEREHIVETPVAFLPQNSQVRSAKEVLQLIENIRATSGISTIYKTRSFADAQAALKDSSLESLDPRYRQAFAEFLEVVFTEGVHAEIEIKEALALLILDVFSHREDSLKEVALQQKYLVVEDFSRNFKPLSTRVDWNGGQMRERNHYGDAYTQARQAGGSCPSTRKDGLQDPVQELIAQYQNLGSNTAIPGINGTDYLSLTEDKYGSLRFECPNCHKEVARPRNTLLKQCPKCHESVKC